MTLTALMLYTVGATAVAVIGLLIAVAVGTHNERNDQ